MEYRRFDRDYYIRLDKGDEIIEALKTLCARENIRAGYFKGIGGCGRASVGVFDAQKKAYNEHTVTSLLELVSLDGNVTFFENAPYIHAHALFAYHEGDSAQLIGGHLLSAEICLTGEIILTPADGAITRRYDDELGIRTWDFE